MIKIPVGTGRNFLLEIYQLMKMKEIGDILPR